MELSLFDLHCDTAYEMHRQNALLKHNHLTISLENARKFKQYIQVMALWTDHALSNEMGWIACFEMYRHLKNDPSVLSGKAVLCTDLRSDDRSQAVKLLLGVEDMRILDGKLERLNDLRQMGVRFVTPLWKGETCIGGSHDTDVGLTDFGTLAVQKAMKMGMIMDISHASEQSSADIFSLAEELHVPVVATHSNAYALCPVSRNLRPWQMRSILKSGGVVGLNLYPAFLRTNRPAHLDDLISHIEYFSEHGCCDRLCLGCDMDGAEMPPEIRTLSDLPLLAERLLQLNYSEETVRKLFYANAFSFAFQYLK